MGFGSPSPPPPPDYAGAARAQGAANVDTARATAKLSNPNVTNVLGERTIRYEDDIPFVTETLSPEQQKLFDAQNRINSALMGIGESGVDRIRDSFSGPFNMDSVTPYSVTPDVSGRDAVVNALIERESPRFERQKEQAENDLLVRGFNPSTEAYDDTMDEINRAENDFRLAALLAGGQEQSRLAGLESARRAQDIQEENYLRSLPLNELNALRTGSQAALPMFQGYQGTQIAPPPIFDAMLAQNQAAQQAYNNRVNSGGGMFDLAGSVLGAAGSAGGLGNLFSFF